jgi:hypothetical protein
MTHWYLDTCSLLNLIASGKIEDIKIALELAFKIVPKVQTEETLYIYERQKDGKRVAVALDLQPYIDKQILIPDTPLAESELETFIAYATLLDDGEAMTIAAAELRNGGVVTDELRAWKILHAHSPQTPRTTSLSLIKQWAEKTNVGKKELQNLFDNIRIRASYLPSPKQPHYEWFEKIMVENDS